MSSLKNVEKWNTLFKRNNVMNKLLSDEDRSILHDLITELSTYDYTLKSLRIFLDLQVILIFTNFLLFLKSFTFLFQMWFFSIEITWQLHNRQIIDFIEFVTMLVKHLLFLFI